MEGLTNEVVLQYIEANADNEELKGALSSKFTVEKEIVKEIEKTYTDDELENILSVNQSLNDKLDEKARQRQIAKALGKKVKELTPEELNINFIPKNSYDDLLNTHENTLKKFEIIQTIGKENFENNKDIIEAYMPKIVKKDDGTYEGLDKLQGLFGSQQTVKPIIKTPAPNPIQKDNAQAEIDDYLRKVGVK